MSQADENDPVRRGRTRELVLTIGGIIAVSVSTGIGVGYAAGLAGGVAVGSGIASALAAITGLWWSAQTGIQTNGVHETEHGRGVGVREHRNG